MLFLKYFNIYEKKNQINEYNSNEIKRIEENNLADNNLRIYRNIDIKLKAYKILNKLKKVNNFGNI